MISEAFVQNYVGYTPLAISILDTPYARNSDGKIFNNQKSSVLFRHSFILTMLYLRLDIISKFSSKLQP